MPAASAAPRTKLISQNSGHAQAGDVSFTGGISANGNSVAFMTAADNLDPGDSNASPDVYLRNVARGKTKIVSVSSSGVNGDGDSEGPAISASGRFIVFASGAHNLIDGRWLPSWQIYLRDRAKGRTFLVSKNSAGGRANDMSFNPEISADGRYVVFESNATNLTGKGTKGAQQIYLRDRKLRKTFLISQNNVGKAGNSYSGQPQVSANGRFVAFMSWATNLTSKDTNLFDQIYLRDRKLKRTFLISQHKGKAANNETYDPRMSADGRFVVFASIASNLAAADTNGKRDIYLRDRAKGKTKRVSLNWKGRQLWGSSGSPDLSDNGRRIVFASGAKNTIKGGLSGAFEHVFRRDLATGKVKLVSRSNKGGQGNGPSRMPRISADGRYVTFTSAATNLVPGGDANGI
ncbi:MAG: calcium-binding protein, partial [Chloroflexota bacterium]|nr:calcium-binding protein [Chloroflexota bacterium]